MDIEEAWEGIKIRQCLIRTKICTCNLNGHMNDRSEGSEKEGRETTTFPVGLCKMKEIPMVLAMQRDRRKKMGS